MTDNSFLNINQIKKIADIIDKKINIKPDIGLILGSGLGVLAEEIENSVYINYSDLPHFPVSTVKGHKGRFVTGKLENKKIIAMQGRFHHYEGYNFKEIVLPVRVMKLLGIKKLIITNAAGGINLNFEPGNFMLITDHINLMGGNPLRGKNIAEFGPRFPDMTEAYSKKLTTLAGKAAAERGIVIKKGIYAALGGPNYETPAEIRFLRTIGADAIGMSTVPEVITARHMQIEVLGISCITNMAAGVLPEPLNHEEVMEIAERAKPEFIELVRSVLNKI